MTMGSISWTMTVLVVMFSLNVANAFQMAPIRVQQSSGMSTMPSSLLRSPHPAWSNGIFTTTTTTSSSTQLAMAVNLQSGVLSPKKKNLKTFQRYLEIECWKRAELRELERVLQAVAESCKQINRIVQRAQTDDLYGAATGKDGKPLEDNIQGEVQQQLDVLCNTIMLRAFCGSSSSIHSVASEEEDEPRCCSDVMVRIRKSELCHVLLFGFLNSLYFALQLGSTCCCCCGLVLPLGQ